jgi:hypothetical protein
MFRGNVDMPCPREPSTQHFLAWGPLEMEETQKSHWQYYQRRWRRSDIEQRGINLWSTCFPGPVRQLKRHRHLPTRFPQFPRLQFVRFQELN